MNKIATILCIVTGACLVVVAALKMMPENRPLTLQEATCINDGFPNPPYTVQDCIELLELELRVKRLGGDLDKLIRAISPGIDI